MERFATRRNRAIRNETAQINREQALAAKAGRPFFQRMLRANHPILKKTQSSVDPKIAEAEARGSQKDKIVGEKVLRLRLGVPFLGSR